MSTIGRDAEVAEIIHNCLYMNKFYDRLASKINGKAYCSLKRSKHSEYDAKIVLPTNELLFREKAQIKFINNPVASFTLEVFDTSRNKDGWLFTDNFDLNYVFIWVLNSVSRYETIQSYAEINKIRLCICQNGVLRGFAPSDIKESIDLIQKQKLPKLLLSNDLLLIRSTKYTEVPINIKVPFDLLVKNSKLCVDFDCKTSTFSTVKSW